MNCHRMTTNKSFYQLITMVFSLRLFSYTQIYLCVAFFLTGCALQSGSPSTERSLLKDGSQTYQVKKGDTLYSIARRHSLDVRQIAAANALKKPYVVYPGDVLSVGKDSSFMMLNDDPDEAAFFSIMREKGIKIISEPPPSTAKKSPLPSPRSEVVVSKPPRPFEQKTTSSKAFQAEKKASTRTKNSVQNIPAVEKRWTGKSGTWLKPVQGKVIKTFSTAGNSKGIDIAAVAGTPVLSSRAGKVVYAGSRLKGYGNLIIIKHDEVWLSAYAHNRSIYVKEGDTIKQGQRIAEVGSTGTYEAKLHFEIRRYGKPVDPLKLLK